jgi:MFS family permease
MAWLPVAAALFGTGWGAQQFTPMLLVYSRALGLSTGTLTAMFGVYALGLIPGLLLCGPLSDSWGRRRVVAPAVAVSLASSVLLATGGHHVPLLYAGRLLAGLSSGAVFGGGTAWLREVSQPPWGTATDAAAARRAVIAMTTGFAAGPLVAGLLAQWAPAPMVVPYLPHIVLMAVVLVGVGAGRGRARSAGAGKAERRGGESRARLRTAPETVGGGGRRPLRLVPRGLRSRRFRTVVVPLAPWAFAAPAVAFALLPSVVGAGRVANGIALTAAVSALTALCGVLIQPLGRRLDARGRGNRAATAGLAVLAAALMLAALAAHERQVWLLVPGALLFGSAYGLCLVAGLIEVHRIASPDALAGLTAVYYMLAYLGFAVPSLLVLAAHLAGYPVLLAITAALALGTAALVTAQAQGQKTDQALRTRG